MFNIWRHSRLRFYILNTIWNYKFWFFCKKIYKNVVYHEPTGEYEMDNFFKLIPKVETKTTKRFVGYLYKNKIYLDNPGLQNIDRNTWKAWKRKKLI